MDKLKSQKCTLCGERGYNSDVIVKRGGKPWHKKCFKKVKKEMRRKLHV